MNENKDLTCRDCIQYDDTKLFDEPCKKRAGNDEKHICFMFRLRGKK